MKSIFLPFFALIFLLGAAQAQPISQQDQLRQQLSNMFRQAEASLQYTSAPVSQPGPSRPQTPSTPWQNRLDQEIRRQINQSQSAAPKLEGAPWQMALFLAAPDRPIAETLGTLRWSIRHGYIKQATVLDLSPAQQNRDFQFYLLYADGRKAKTQRLSLPADTGTQLLLEELTQHLQKYNGSLQTGIIIDAHGSTESIYFDRNSQGGEDFSLQILTDTAQKFHLHIDALQLISCHVGTISNVQLLAQNNLVDYTVISSDVAMGDGEQFYYSLLWYACYPAQKAARMASTWHIRMHGPWMAGEDARNAMALDLRTLDEKLENWGDAYFNLCASQGQYTDLTEENQSFRLFAQRQIQRIKTGDVSAVCTPNYAPTERALADFVQTGERLLEELDGITLAQWCQPPGQERFIRQNLSQNGCTDGPSVNKDSWNQLWNTWKYKRIRHMPDL